MICVSQRIWELLQEPNPQLQLWYQQPCIGAEFADQKGVKPENEAMLPQFNGCPLQNDWRIIFAGGVGWCNLKTLVYGIQAAAIFPLFETLYLSDTTNWVGWPTGWCVWRGGQCWAQGKWGGSPQKTSHPQNKNNMRYPLHIFPSQVLTSVFLLILVFVQCYNYLHRTVPKQNHQNMIDVHIFLSFPSWFLLSHLHGKTC